MTLEQAMGVIEAERLAWYARFTLRLEADKVYMVREGAAWSVFATDERAAVEGRVSAYPLEREAGAVDEFLDRLRAARRLNDENY